MVEKQYPEVHVIKNQTNMGFAIACNQGIKMSKGEYITLLNNDIEVEPNWLTKLYEGMERHPECGMGTTKMMFLDQRDVFYNTGDLFHAWSAGGGRGQGEKDIGQYDKEDYVFGACAGAGIYRREFFLNKSEFLMKTFSSLPKMLISICADNCRDSNASTFLRLKFITSALQQ